MPDYYSFTAARIVYILWLCSFFFVIVAFNANLIELIANLRNPEKYYSSKKYFLRALLFALLGFFGWHGGDRFYNYLELQRVKKLEKVVDAIFLYEQKQGHFPETLDDSILNYNPSILKSYSYFYSDATYSSSKEEKGFFSLGFNHSREIVFSDIQCYVMCTNKKPDGPKPAIIYNSKNSYSWFKACNDGFHFSR